MQTTPLPIQVSTPSPAPQRANAAPQADNAQFSQALSREVQQRQDSPAPAVAKPQAAPAPAPAKPASAKANDAKPASAKAHDARPASAGTDAASDAAKDDAADAADAAAITPVADLIALVASYNQATAPGAPANDPVAAEAAAAAVSVAATGTGKQLKADLAPAPAKAPALPAAADQAIVPAGKDPVAAIEGAARFSVKELAGAAVKETRAQAAEPALARPAAGAADTQQPAAAAAPKADLPDMPAAPVHATAEPAAAPALAPAPLHAEPAPLRVRDADVAIVKDPAPAAPVAAPLQQASLAVAQAAGGVPADRIAARVGTPGWDQQVGQKIIWMVAGKDQSATLTLNPPDMGPMQVVLNVHNDQASVTFSAAQPEVRQALENAMPKLREMMSESGISLGNATVDAGTPDQRQAQQNEQARSQRAGGRIGNSGAVEAPLAAPRAARSGGGAGLVDTFA